MRLVKIVTFMIVCELVLVGSEINVMAMFPDKCKTLPIGKQAMYKDVMSKEQKNSENVHCAGLEANLNALNASLKANDRPKSIIKIRRVYAIAKILEKKGFNVSKTYHGLDNLFKSLNHNLRKSKSIVGQQDYLTVFSWEDAGKIVFVKYNKNFKIQKNVEIFNFVGKNKQILPKKQIAKTKPISDKKEINVASKVCHMRIGPSTAYPTIPSSASSYTKQNDIVKKIYHEENGWYFVAIKDTKKIGWVAKSCFKLVRSSK